MNGSQKPFAGAQIDPDHPFSQGLVCCFPGIPNTGVSRKVPDVIAADQRVVSSRSDAGSDPLTWGSNADGPCVIPVAGEQRFQLSGAIFFPTSECTLTLIIRNSSDVFMYNGLGGANRFLIAVPHVDNVVYLDYGGSSSPNRLTVSSLTFNTNRRPDRWVFTAGPRGSAIWQNGVKVGSQSTAVTRTESGAPDGLYWSYSEVACDINYWALYNRQWDDTLCRGWSAEPSAHFSTGLGYLAPNPHGARTRAALMAAAAAAAASGTGAACRRTLSALGTRTGSRQEHC